MSTVLAMLGGALFAFTIIRTGMWLADRDAERFREELRRPQKGRDQ